MPFSFFSTCTQSLLAVGLPPRRPGFDCLGIVRRSYMVDPVDWLQYSSGSGDRARWWPAAFLSAALLDFWYQVWAVRGGRGLYSADDARGGRAASVVAVPRSLLCIRRGGRVRVPGAVPPTGLGGSLGWESGEKEGMGRGDCRLRVNTLSGAAGECVLGVGIMSS